VKDRLNALKNPYAHLQIADISLEKVKESPVLWDPLRFLESCPSSDGACAMVLASPSAAAGVDDPAWIVASSVRSELGFFPGRDGVRPQAGVDCAHDLYRRAGISDPRREIDMAELYVPFSWYEPMWLEGHDIAPLGEGWKMTEQGETEMTGAWPVNPSGGVLSSNPIGASGMLRMAEAALQVRGRAGEHQVAIRHGLTLAQAYGGNAQYFAMAIFGARKPG
jgi:acetyl-CoA C-acetyltransferase